MERITRPIGLPGGVDEDDDPLRRAWQQLGELAPRVANPEADQAIIARWEKESRDAAVRGRHQRWKRWGPAVGWWVGLAATIAVAIYLSRQALPTDPTPELAWEDDWLSVVETMEVTLANWPGPGDCVAEFAPVEADIDWLSSGQEEEF
jgi:hypothetical protein